MKKISLIVGETASLPKEIIEKYGMVVIPYLIDWREDSDLLGNNIFQKMREAEKLGIKTLPKTSQPSPRTFKKFFEQELKKSEKILCITLSSKLSGGYNSALQAKGMLDTSDQKKVHILDCFNITAGEGLFDLKTVKLIEKGKKIEEILEELKRFIPKVHLFGMLGDPKWSEAGGRLSHTLAVLIKQMEKIGMRPLIGLKNGEVKPIALRTKAKDIPTALFKELEKETKGKKVILAIVHADNLTRAKKLKEMVEEKLKEIEIAFINLIDPIIGVHTGPDTLVCAWCEV